MPISDFKTNPTAAVEGVWVDYSPNADNSVPRFKIARMARTNRSYLKTLDAESKPVRRSIELETLPPGVAEQINLKVFVKSILLAWENVQPNDDGKNLEFNQKNALDLLGSPEYEDLLNDLQRKAQSAALFRDEALEQDAKN